MASSADSSISFHINENVKNSDTEYFKCIQENWVNYLNSNYFVKTDNELWSYDMFDYPDYGYISLLLRLIEIYRNGGNIQSTTIAIVPVENDYYLLKTVFTEQLPENHQMVDIKFIISVYAKKKDQYFKFYSSTQYHKEICENIKVGNVNYVLHSEHQFSMNDALKMNQFNTEVAELFGVEPLSFDYMVANDTRDLSELLGVNLFSYSYQPVPSGGMTDNYNQLIYAGNNSEYYPHEVVHLYTNAKYSLQYHPWVDEGIAALLGGSTGYDIEWHWEKLRRFLIENPDYPLEDLSVLESMIPNGEFMTDFRYAIGALICQKIIDKEGMTGIFEALQYGRAEENYFALLKDKLDIERADFGRYVSAEILKLTPLTEVELEDYKY